MNFTMEAINQATQEGKIVVHCSWHEANKPAPAGYAISHTICKECERELRKDLRQKGII